MTSVKKKINKNIKILEEFTEMWNQFDTQKQKIA